MQRIHHVLLLVFGALLFPMHSAHAQSITITPTSPSVAVGKALQFSAKVTGLSSTNVQWSAAGAVGGNATGGTISTAGLYKAPATLPAQNPVQITATSAVNSMVSASVYVNILAQGPKITSVSPNPLAVGAITVTIHGTGFQTGAEMYVTYGSNSLVQMSTSSVTPTTITATGWLGQSTSAIFCVRNPGSDFSNSLSVPVSGATQYTLSVVNGVGGGSYAAGTVVTITANAAPAGKSFANWTGATVANPNAATTTLTMPAANATVTANYAVAGTYALTVVNGAGSGSYAPGKVVTITANAAPAGKIFTNWTGATVANPNASTTTLTMPSANTTVTANYAVNTGPIPFPVTTHPRLWITQNDLPKLQSWATASNPVYTQGMQPLLAQAINIYKTQFFPNGVANPNYPDPGDVQGYTGYLSEQYGAVLAFNSLIDPNPANRIQYAQYARNLLMYAMNKAALGHLANAPFRDPAFAIYNRGDGSGEQWPLIVDWIYNAKDAQNNPILTAADKATIRKVFMIWSNDCLNASTTGGDHPEPIGVMNDPQLLPNNQPYRMAANNYYLGHARLLTMMALSIDPSDDPPLNSSVSSSVLGNSLRSYIQDATGAWLYQVFAMFGDPSAVENAYGITGSGSGFGLASGGLPPEGMLYGLSLGTLLEQLLALQTAGFNNPAYAGPQIQLIGAPIWDRYVTGYISSLVPSPIVDPTQPWLGPVYQFAGYGDMLRIWEEPDSMEPFAVLALLDQQNGKTNHLNAARWFAVNVAEGGANALMTRINTPWSYSSSLSILYYLLLDPTAPTATDPRPSFPTTFFDAPAGRIVAHSDWSAKGTMFDYRASWISINHQNGDGGQFELYRKGEWLTKEMSNYDNNDVGLTTVYHNTLALQNWCANGVPPLGWNEGGIWKNGSQWMWGGDAGDPTTMTSTGPGYLYVTSDLTNLFNHPSFWTPANGAVDIKQATRSIVWLNNDYIVVYDRATSGHSGLFKRFNLSLVTNPTISGNVATEQLASGQQLFIQTLLPKSPSLTATYAAGGLSPIAIMEPTKYIYTVEDPTRPANTRFLHVLQGADAGTTMVASTYVQSLSGTAFDGAVFGTSAVFFPVNTTGTFAATSFPAPTGVHTLLVTGLAPDATYSVSIQPTASGNVITLTSAATGTPADSAGVLNVSF